MNNFSFINFFWRSVIFLTLLLVAYIFFRPNDPEIAGQKRQEPVSLNHQYNIFFLNPNRDSLFITGSVEKIDKQIFVNGQIKSLSKFKTKNVDIEFCYYSENNVRLGREILSLQKEIMPKALAGFRKEGLTIPDNTKEIRIRILDQVKKKGYAT